MLDFWGVHIYPKKLPFASMKWLKPPNLNEANPPRPLPQCAMWNWLLPSSSRFLTPTKRVWQLLFQEALLEETDGNLTNNEKDVPKDIEDFIIPYEKFIWKSVWKQRLEQEGNVSAVLRTIWWFNPFKKHFPNFCGKNQTCFETTTKPTVEESHHETCGRFFPKRTVAAHRRSHDCFANYPLAFLWRAPNTWIGQLDLGGDWWMMMENW